MDLRPAYPAGANTTGLIAAGLLVAFGFGIMQPILGLALRLVSAAASIAGQAG